MGRKKTFGGRGDSLSLFPARLASGMLPLPEQVLSHSYPQQSSESNLNVKGGISGWGEEDLNFNPSSAISWLADVQGTPTLRQMNAIHDAGGLLSFSFQPVEWELAQIAPITNSYALVNTWSSVGKI